MKENHFRYPINVVHNKQILSKNTHTTAAAVAFGTRKSRDTKKKYKQDSGSNYNKQTKENYNATVMFISHSHFCFVLCHKKF